jgi:heme/copper-type cytochrome/quinol oxidase subunit 4
MRIFPAGHFVIGLLFLGSAVALIGLAALQLWQGIQIFDDVPLNERLNAVLESIAVLTVAVAALELGQTILEEEVQREAQMSAPTRVRRFLSRFMVVLVVALTIEALVLVFRYSHEAPENMAYAAIVAFSAAALMVGWGVFIRLNTGAEELEPEGMRQAKEEDKKMR